MIETSSQIHLLVLLMGVLIVLTMLVKPACARSGTPALIGYLLLGLLVRLLDQSWNLLSDEQLHIFTFLGKIGLFCLLFKVGLETDLRGLLKQLRSASMIWMADISISGLLGFAVAFYLLGLGWITSLIVATAFTATSVGITVAVWQNRNALQSDNGELLVDVAELDDLSAVLLMGLLFAVLPAFKVDGQTAAVLLSKIALMLGTFIFKLVAFGSLCFAFSRFLEARLTKFFQNLESGPDPMLTIAGIGFVIAAAAGWLGFSVAIGAFFAGLVFSRDPETVKMEASFMPVYDLLSPFFFIAIGLQLDPETLGTALGSGLVLAAVAIASKVLAAGLPIIFTRGRRAALLIGVSMVPRAEISMVIMQKAASLGHWAVSNRVYGAMIVVCTVTCVLAPLLVRRLLTRWPPQAQEHTT